MSNLPTALRLTERLDIRAAALLSQELMFLRGRDAALDASAVKQIGGLCLQVILAAQASWAADGFRLVTANRSQSFEEAVKLSGARLNYEGE